MTKLFTNCKTYSSTGWKNQDILVDDFGKIAPLGSLNAKEVIDLKGQIVLPGLIDVHVHLRDPGQLHKEDFYTGTSAALAGGITTVLDMPNNATPTISQERLEEKEKLAREKAVCDFGFYIGATDKNASEAANSSAVAMKIYIGATTGDLLVDDENHLDTLFSQFKRTIAVHSEDNACMNALSTKYEQKVENHNKFRAPECAEISLIKAIKLTRKYNAKLHVAHMSTRRELELIKKAKSEGLHVSCEVTPHHLFLNENVTTATGNFARVNPPIRGEDDRMAMWDSLSYVDCIATDHAPHTIQEKEQEYSKAPSGIPGLETTLPLLLDAYSKNQISLEEIVRLTSEGPAKVFGLYEKGTLEVGKDADFVIIDMNEKTTLRNGELKTKCNWTIFNGTECQGKVKQVYLRGKLVNDNGKIIAEKGDGKIVKHK